MICFSSQLDSSTCVGISCRTSPSGKFSSFSSIAMRIYPIIDNFGVLYRFLLGFTKYFLFNVIPSICFIRKELEISGIQDVSSKHKQNWINHLERMDKTRLPKHALSYKPGGRRDCGRPRKRWQGVDAGTGQST